MFAKYFIGPQKRQGLPTIAFRLRCLIFKDEKFLKTIFLLGISMNYEKNSIISDSYWRLRYLDRSGDSFLALREYNLFYHRAEIQLVILVDRLIQWETFMDLTKCSDSMPCRSTIVQHWDWQFSISRRSFNLERLDQKPASCAHHRVDLSLSLSHSHNYWSSGFNQLLRIHCN